jgi:hypothetical protein
MAYIHPTNTEALQLDGAHRPEVETLKRLGRELANDYTVFHSVRWAADVDRRSGFGEIDFLVVNQDGDVLLIEQKDGDLVEHRDDLAKDYGHASGPKSVINQIHRARDGLREALNRADLGFQPRLELMLYAPGHRVGNVPAGLQEAAIVDAGRRDGLAAVIRERLGPGSPKHAGGARKVREIISQSLDLHPDIHHDAEYMERTYTRLAGGMAEVIAGLEMPAPWRLRVKGAAGSGKTLAAMEFFRAAEQRGERAALICFNRPLGDALRSQLGQADHVGNFHALARRWLEGYAGIPFEVERTRTDQNTYWNEVIDQLIEHSDALPKFDTLILDEGQDLEGDWWELLRLLITDEGRVLWLEDPEQDLYGRNHPDLDHFVTLDTRASYRTPRRVADFIEKHLAPGIQWRNPLEGLPPIHHKVKTEAEAIGALEATIRELEENGFTPDQIVLLTRQGLNKSYLKERDELAGYRLKRPTGNYTGDGRPEETDGQLRLETVYRFKGEQAPAAILVDGDLSGLKDQRQWQLHYCAFTRASVALGVVE